MNFAQLWSGLALAGPIGPGPSAWQDERIDRLATVELRARGPLESVELELGEADRARFELALGAGESVRQTALVPSASRRLEARVVTRPDGPRRSPSGTRSARRASRPCRGCCGRGRR